VQKEMSAKGQERTLPCSLDQFIGALLEMCRHVKAKPLSGFQIDHELEFDRSLHGKPAWFLALKNAINIRRRASKIIGQIISVGQQAAEFSEDTIWIDGGETVAGRQRCDLRPMFGHEGIRHHNQAAIRLVCLCGNDGVELGCVVNRCDDRLDSEGRGSANIRHMAPLPG
jgi:hypothetical protein